MPLEGIDTEAFDLFEAFVVARITERPAGNIARLGRSGAVRTIKAVDRRRDGTGKPRRGPVKRVANDTVREKFKTAVANLFGGEDKIPKNVKKAMSPEEYERDKPLTARRIDAVRQAVERHFADSPEAFAKARAHAGSVGAAFGEEAVDAAVEAGVSAVAADADAARLVARHIERFIVGGDATLRAPDEIREKARGLLAGVAELRAAAKGDRKAFEAGIRFLDRLGGEALPPGVFAAVFADAKAKSVKALKGVGPDSGASGLHAALDVFVRGADAIMLKSGAGAALDGAAKTACREFVGTLLALKCGRKDAQSLHAAFRSGAGATLLRFYGDLGRGDVPFKGIAPGAMQALAGLAPVYGARMEQFDAILAGILGIEPERGEGIPPLQGSARLDDGDVAEIALSLLELVPRTPEG